MSINELQDEVIAEFSDFDDWAHSRSSRYERESPLN